MDQVLGWIATTLFTACYVPQIFKTIRTKTLDGVSVALFVISFIANIVALAYATLIEQRPLQIKYSVALVIIGVLLVVLFVWGRKSKSRPANVANPQTCATLSGSRGLSKSGSNEAEANRDAGA